MRYLKHCLQALLTLSHQVLTRFFALFFLIHFPHYLAAWNRLGSLLHTVQRHYDVFHKNEKKLPKKTADISRRHHWFSPKNNWKKKEKKQLWCHEMSAAFSSETKSHFWFASPLTSGALRDRTSQNNSQSPDPKGWTFPERCLEWRGDYSPGNIRNLSTKI